MPELIELSIKDFDVIKELFRSVFTAPPWNDDWSDEDQLDNYLKDLMMVRTPLILGLKEGDVLAGVSVGNIKHWCRGTEYFIEELFVRTDMQGRGYGTLFMKSIESYLKEHGINQIFLHTERSKPSYDFYRKLGFTDLTELASFFKEF
jgi:aminoglycoside 6'-N-acetyltransferase I